MHEVGFFNNFDGEIERNPWRYSLDALIGFAKDNPQGAVKSIQRAISNNEQLQLRFLEMLRRMLINNQNYPREYFKAHIELYSRLVGVLGASVGMMEDFLEMVPEEYK